MKIYHIEDMEYEAPQRFKVLKLKAKGYSNQEVADALGLSLHTIKQHLYMAPQLYKERTWLTLVLKMKDLRLI